MPQISELLEEMNPWWKGAFDLDFKERDVYKEVQKFLGTKQVIAFTGLRRVGKTTLMLKIVSDYIKKGFDPKRIIYFSFDEMKNVEIRDIIKEYEKLFGFSVLKGRYLLLLDEIQKVDGWQDKLKGVYDTYSGLYSTTKIVISGSESLFIRKMTKESLSGRIFEFEVRPLTFAEFLGFKNEGYEPIAIHGRELKLRLEQYIRMQGFPELIGMDDYPHIKKYITENIIDKVVYKDIPAIFKVDNTDAMASLLRILTEAPGQLVEYSSLAKDLGISRYTVAAYLTYLENSFIVRKLYNYSGSVRSSERSLKKYYACVISPELASRQDDYHKSMVFEWMVVQQLRPKFFWRDAYGHEVDCIIRKEGGSPVPLEIKYGKIDYGGMVAFSKKFGAKNGYIVSSDTEADHEKDGVKIAVRPAYKFLLEPHKTLDP